MFVHEWLGVVRRARLGRTVKAVALMLASYANVDGTKVFPGIARLSVECELSAKAVKGALASLRTVGLVEVVRAARKAGEHNEYRLILAEDLLERLDVPTPTAHAASIAAVADSIRGRHKLRGTPDPADYDDDEDLQGTAVPADEPNDAEPAGNGTDDTEAPAGNGTDDLRGTPLPPTYPVPIQTPTNQDPADVRADLTVPGATCPAHPPMPAGLRGDGAPRCPPCRALARTSTRPRLQVLQGGAAS